jgi:hypothetical protein
MSWIRNTAGDLVDGSNTAGDGGDDAPGSHVVAPELQLLYTEPVLRIRIRIHRIHMFLGLLDPDPLVRGMDRDPDPSIIMQK